MNIYRNTVVRLKKDKTTDKYRQLKGFKAGYFNTITLMEEILNIYLWITVKKANAKSRASIIITHP